MADNTNREQVELNEKLKNLKKEILSLTEKTTRLSETEVKKLSELRNEYKEIYIEKRKAESEQAKNFSDQIKSAASLSSLYQNLTSLERDRIEKSIKYKSLTDDQQKSISRIAELNRDLAQTSSDESELKKSILADIDIEKAKIGKVHHTQQSIVDNLNQQTEEALVLGNLTKTQKEFLEKQLSIYDGIKDTIGGVLETTQLLLSTNKGMFGAALIGAGAFIGKLGEIRSQLGGIAEIGTTALSFIDDNAVENAKELSTQFGGISNVSTELQAATSLISSNMGISGTEAASLLGTFSRLNEGSSETALNLVKSSQEFAKQNGLIPSQLLEDMAGSAEEFALYGKNGGKNLIEAAAAARKMGVELKTMTTITSNLLDFENSITKELELSAMLGKSINLDRARGLAYAGKETEAVEETLRAIGGIEAFNKMDPFAKQAAADLLGIQVSEFQKMVSLQENAAELSGTMAEDFNMAGEFISAGLNKYLGTTVQGLGGALIVIGQMGAGLKTVADTGKSAFDIIKSLGSKIFQKSTEKIGEKATDSISEKIEEKLSNTTDTMAQTSDKNKTKGGGVGQMLQGISSGIKSFAAIPVAAIGKLALILGTLTLAIIGIGYALNVAAPGIEAFGNAISSIVSAVGGVVVGIIGALGDVFMKISSVASPEMALSIIGLAGGFSLLSAALTSFAITGLAAIPAMVAVGGFATLASGIDSLFGNETGGNTAENDTMNMLLEEIKGLRSDLNAGKVAVYMDGTKVTSGISRVVSKTTKNQYI
jgi:hypothetical protein